MPHEVKAMLNYAAFQFSSVPSCELHAAISIISDVAINGLLADLKKSACRIVVCNTHIAILQLFQRSETNLF